MPRKVPKMPPPPLHELESEVMEEIWRREKATVRDVLEALNKGRKKRAYTTIMTIMGRLYGKGLLSRERLGKPDIYSPVMARDAYLHARAEAEVQELVDEFGEVALAQFAAQMDRLDPKRLKELRQLARND
jgi:predicted transcriptional regulator